MAAPRLAMTIYYKDLQDMNNYIIIPNTYSLMKDFIMTAPTLENQPNSGATTPPPPLSAQIISALGAAGVAMQNYPAVMLFLQDTLKHLPATQASTMVMHGTALATGGFASGMVNYWMNLDLMERFYKRMFSNEHTEPQYIRYELSAWQQFIYFGGILLFVITGILFGLMAFTFALQGPLAILSGAAGLFVTAIMTIQEVETWLKSYDDKYDPKNISQVPPQPLTKLETLGKYCGHFIAAGNVLALSLLFALGLTQTLLFWNIMTALPALITGFFVAFTAGAFTEYFFYNAYLADFGQKYAQKWQEMQTIPHLWFGIICIAINAIVNGALAYSGVPLLSGLFVAANVGLPPVAAITALAVISGIFSGSASYILGAAFWIDLYAKKDNTPSASDITTPPTVTRSPSYTELADKMGAFRLKNNNGAAGNEGYDLDQTSNSYN
jgi:hypothetical protein